MSSDSEYKPYRPISSDFLRKMRDVYSKLKFEHGQRKIQSLQDFRQKHRQGRANRAAARAQQLDEISCKFEDNNPPASASSGSGAQIAKAACFTGSDKRNKIKLQVPTIMLEPITPIPPGTVYAQLKRNIRVADEAFYENIPYISDETIESKKKNSFLKVLNEKYDGYKVDEGSKLQKKLPDELYVDFVNAMISQQASSSAASSTLPDNIIFRAINQVFANNNIDPSKLRARYFNLVGKTDLLCKKISENIDGDMTNPQSRELTMKSFRSKFCRRCYMYGCRLHGHIDPPKKPQVAVAAATSNASQACGENCSKFLDGTIRSSPSKKSAAQKLSSSKRAVEVDDVWTASDQSVFYMLRQTMSYCDIAVLLETKSCAQVYEFEMLETTLKVPKAEKSQKLPENMQNCQKPTKYKDFIKHASRVSSKQKEKSENLNCYIPCDHEGACTKQLNCPCIFNYTFCEKFCSCSDACKNRFQGCHCGGKCETKSCVCFASNRECDPDLCKTCGSDKVDIDQMNCNNVNAQRLNGKHIFLGVSDISGWGAFINSKEKKGEFIGEYTGEVISKEEGDRRAAVYDERRHSFLFDLNKQLDVDSYRKGNKLRFANCPTAAKKANLRSQVMMVNGDHRICMYASRDIDAGEELILNYNWSKQIKSKFGIDVSNKTTGSRKMAKNIKKEPV